ncbi:carboxymuconolactone decarboxylase family protein [Agarilytica rhodophyticola]|uniref:carboxymuconolactone decarboxylase family protein n=1 Tax=Agarilytica rhodophyticola TaxID=1737490 RepID=UPI000B347DA7|nr:carboxymuconolactone decarboxylase family protein [Agarilytica rhodophyticola]
MQRIGYTEVPSGVFDAMMQTEEYLKSSDIDFKTLELMRVRVSQINGCAYCVDMHYKEAIAAGEEHQRLYSLTCWREAPYYSDQERAILAWAEAITEVKDNSNVGISEDYKELESFLSKKEIANLTLAISAINSWNRLMIAFGFEAGNYEVSK